MHIYVEKGLITEEQYQKAIAYQKMTQLSFHEALLKLSFICEDKVVHYCETVLGS